MGAGGIIQQNSVVRTAVNDPSVYGVLPDVCKGQVETVNLKPLGDWGDADYALMVGMLLVARHCK